MRRRDFITLLGGAAAAWPVAARAQQAGRVWRVGVLFAGDSDPRLSWIVQRLGELGWIEGRNLRMDTRFGAGNPDRIRMFAKELVNLKPDVLIGGGGESTRALQQQTRGIPIIFTGAGASLDAGLVKNIARPEGNMTGITNLFPSITSKWLELLKEADPRITRVALVVNPDLLPGPVAEKYLAPAEAAAAQFAVTTMRAPYHSPSDVDRAIDAFATGSAGDGLIVLPPTPVGSNTVAIRRAALRNKLPMITYTPAPDPGPAGGLMSYGPVPRDLARAVASYADHILRGATVSDLPVQYPTTFELIINLKNAKAIGLALPRTLVARADAVIE
jgi:putative tryptophan/tyrosine transport system substrate-binding protein